MIILKKATINGAGQQSSFKARSWGQQNYEMRYQSFLLVKCGLVQRLENDLYTEQ